MTKHLYIHIPFCKNICTYCNFYRRKEKDLNIISKYIDDLIKKIDKIKNKFKTIYIGGGTPNYLDDDLLSKLLCSLQKNLNNTEFTIECNPEFVSNKQVAILKKFNINRISLGAQSLNNNILKILNREHTKENINKSMDLFKKYEIRNISCDFIYNLPGMEISDLYEIFDFIKKHNIKHISFYSLELKEGSKLFAEKYNINDEKGDVFFEKIIKYFNDEKFLRYEISNFAKSKKYFAKHNIAYWKLSDWKAIGEGAFGYEKNIYYKNLKNNIQEKEIWSNEELYKNIFIMGLRMIDGISLKSTRNKKSFDYLKDIIEKDINIKNNCVSVKNINFLNDLLIKII